MKAFVKNWAGGLAVAGLLLGCGGAEEAPAPEGEVVVVARVGDQTITLEEFDASIARLPRTLQDRYQDPVQRQRYLDQLVDRELLLVEARQRGLDDDAALRAKIEDLERRLLVDAVQRAVAADATSDEAMQAYYDANTAEYTSERVRVRHILVKDPELAAQLLVDLEGGADFVAVAREHSTDPSARRGGDLGYVTRGRMDPAFEAAAFALTEPGQRSAVVTTRFGQHIIELVEAPQSHTRPYEQVKLAIRQKLQREAVDARVAALREQVEIETTLPVQADEQAPAAAP